MGAPGYQPHRELPPHAPMPGAPPYPAAEEHPPPPVGERSTDRTALLAIITATAAAVLNVLLELVVNGPRGVERTILEIVVSAVLTAALLWPATRGRQWPPAVVVLAGVAGYFLLRALATLVLG
jgi:hypothetical protein